MADRGAVHCEYPERRDRNGVSVSTTAVAATVVFQIVSPQCSWVWTSQNTANSAISVASSTSTM